MELIKEIVEIGFLFFLIKGLLWIVLFLLVYFGLMKKEKMRAILQKLRFKKKSKEL
jgi:hypothetical protein